ncbi:MAG: TetR/AcrR family transcriptional regulator [Anaerolineales bacterium]
MSPEPADPAGSSRRERHVLRQRKEIMDAAARLFAERGYAGSTTKDIAVAADIGESTLYGYFPSKREVLVAILSEKAQQVDSAFSETLGLSDRKALVGLADTVMNTVLTNVVYTRTLIGEAWVDDDILHNYVVSRTNRITKYLKDLISAGVSAGTFRPIDPGMGARIVVATFIGALLPVLRGIEPPPSPEGRRALAETVVSLLLDGAIVRIRA